jgi:hypothetical protein
MRPTKIKISKVMERFCVEPVGAPGTPKVGWGRTMAEAFGSFLCNYQKELGLEIEVDATALPAETARRKRELARR